MRKKEISAKSATNGTFAVEEARLDFSVRLVGPVTRILPVLVGNQFLIATYAPPYEKAGVVPSLNNFSLLGLLHDCT
jgi:hypothetical protein